MQELDFINVKIIDLFPRVAIYAFNFSFCCSLPQIQNLDRLITGSCFLIPWPNSTFINIIIIILK